MARTPIGDILISELPRTSILEREDLFVFDQVGAIGGIETKAVTLKDLSIMILSSLNGGDGDGNGDNISDIEIILPGRTFFGDGTEIEPSITFIRDRNTGFYRPDNDTIGMTTGGSACMILKNNNVGIGIKDPQHRLHVRGGNFMLELADGYTNNKMLLGNDFNGLPSLQIEGPFDFTIYGGQYIGAENGYTLDERLRLRNLGAVSFGPTGNNFGEPGQVLMSQGPDGTPVWGNLAAELLRNRGLVDVTTMIPANDPSRDPALGNFPDVATDPRWGHDDPGELMPGAVVERGDFWVNVGNGAPRPEFDLSVNTVIEAQLLTWTGYQWIITKALASDLYVDLINNQVIDGEKTFLQVIQGSITDCERYVKPGEREYHPQRPTEVTSPGLILADPINPTNPGQLTADVYLSVDGTVVRTLDHDQEIDGRKNIVGNLVIDNYDDNGTQKLGNFDFHKQPYLPYMPK